MTFASIPRFAILLPAFLLIAAGCGGEAPPVPTASGQTLDRYLSRYAPYEMAFDASSLPERDRAMLRKLAEAAAFLDTAFRMQNSAQGLRWRDSLAALPTDPVGRKLQTLLDRNGGPYEMLHGDSAFMGGGSFPPGGEIYPPGMTTEEFAEIVSKLSGEDREAFLSPYTVIREDGAGGYVAVPYHVEYARWIEPSANLLEEAAGLSDDPAFARFLRLKAEALRTDHYFDADTAWVALRGNRYDLIFGPDETYSDGVAGIKAKYQANVEVVDVDASLRLEGYVKYLNDLERNLPVGKEYQTVVEGLTTNFLVVTDIARTAEAAVGYQAVATNLPNDPEVHLKKGTRKTFWKNVMKARFNEIVRPVALKTVHPEQLQYLTHDGYFQVVLMHEICHALGPRTVKRGPNAGIEVNLAIGPEYSALEEAKADLAGLHSLAWLMDHKAVDPGREKEFWTSYLGSLLRTVRFGNNESHGKAAAAALNYLAAGGGIRYDPLVKRWSVDFGKFRSAVAHLTRDLVVLEGDGDPAAVERFFGRWAAGTDAVSDALSATSGLATDILPGYSVRWD